MSHLFFFLKSRFNRVWHLSCIYNTPRIAKSILLLFSEISVQNCMSNCHMSQITRDCSLSFLRQDTEKTHNLSLLFGDLYREHFVVFLAARFLLLLSFCEYSAKNKRSMSHSFCFINQSLINFCSYDTFKIHRGLSIGIYFYKHFLKFLYEMSRVTCIYLK